MLEITAQLGIPDEEFQWTYVRSGGPGGQNVNKVASKAVLRWDVKGSPSLPDEVKVRLCISRPVALPPRASSSLPHSAIATRNATARIAWRNCPNWFDVPSIAHGPAKRRNLRAEPRKLVCAKSVIARRPSRAGAGARRSERRKRP